MTEAQSKCIECKSDLPEGARKCLKCGSRQDWRRFLDFGNTSASLLIATISVMALGAQNLIDLTNWFSDPERGGLTVKITSLGPERISLYIDNDGPGSVVFNQTALCSIWPTEKSSTLWVGVDGEPNKYFDSRYPTAKEVVGRYIYSYGDRSPIIVKSGQEFLHDLNRRELLIQNKDGINSNENEVKSYCFFDFIHENTSQDAIIDIVDSLEVSFFATERDVVKQAIEEYENIRKKRALKD
ncbi:hypothetical protein [Cohaesibacter intestini]|uniref:hypothetical protein n=1 Tax=Cohaesibacter intestini TaxID=2211145 RepID=UPI001300B43F|nr:hypothetical protein [Cohaesibacter intestini]